MRILVVEDDVSINRLIVESLKINNFEVVSVSNGTDAITTLQSTLLDLVIIDLMLPDMNGMDILSHIDMNNLPVIIVSAIIGSENISKGLQLGADDYLTKPFDVIELQSRVSALLRRVKGKAEIYQYETISVDITAHEVFKEGIPIPLTSKEFELLVLLIQNRNMTLKRSFLYEQIWGDDLSYESRTLDLHIQRLRKKLDLKNNILSVYKLGYKLV
ncbi:response regulator transcription factor [Erysipelothrix aquatica]|uniref:response regulator transcription factor n=1 Tax=Erysipelothrix aquatica TaxID=2683714 RepID=UPI00135B2379|nr:response regulator transcription factor [Erysipelothrix aquatica]